MKRMVPLEDLAQVSLGYKSLQNAFFYVNRETIKTYQIEQRFLLPIHMLADLNASCYLQAPEEGIWLFVCREKEADLRGTGALRYINAMADRSATKKKQSAGTKTMREVLEAQGGGLWYAPKAKPHPSGLWLRKAFNTVYAPFVFETPAVVDQRCNYLEPKDELPWELLGAVITSSLFAYALEINGATSLGAGALEAPTSKLRRYPVFDPRGLKPTERKELVRLTRAVWSGEPPPDWSAKGVGPSAKLRALDAWLLKKSGTGVTAAQLYDDLRAACASRITVAEDKARTTIKKRVDNLTTVAKGIADQVRPLLNGRRFPENFGPEGRDTFHIVVARAALRRITLDRLLGHVTVKVTGEADKELFKGTFELPVAEAIVRALLLSRETFHVPSNRNEAEAAVTAFFAWFDDIRGRLDVGINESALGTGYEGRLRAEVYQRLGVHILAGERILPNEITITPPSAQQAKGAPRHLGRSAASIRSMT